jgi:uncharacterized damage-inducible protein DinB
MSQIAAFQQELEREAETTRKMLSVVPTDKFDWKPHPKSMTIKVLATHIADIFTWFGLVINSSELDFAKNPYQAEEVNSTPELASVFEKNLVQGRTALANAKDAQLTDNWIMRNGAEIWVNDNKHDVLRMCFGQIIHHRAQMGVFLRLLNVPIPGSYGPSADEMGL